MAFSIMDPSTHWDFTLGAMYANQQNLSTETNVNVINLDSNVLRTKITVGTLYYSNKLWIWFFAYKK